MALVNYRECHRSATALWHSLLVEYRQEVLCLLWISMIQS